METKNAGCVPMRLGPYGRKIFLMIVFVFLVAIVLFTNLCTTFTSNGKIQRGKKIVVVVEDRIADFLQDEIQQYKSDLRKEGVQVSILNDVSATSDPAQIKTLLQQEYQKSQDIEGVVLVGRIPAILFNEKSLQGSPYLHDFLSDLYYMDLDGYWEDTDGNGIYDTHRNFRNDLLEYVSNLPGISLFPWCKRKLPEIWVSRIRADTLPSIGNEIVLLKEYFAKINAYREGKLPLPPRRAFVAAAGIDVLRSDWGANPKELFSDVSLALCQDNTSSEFRKYLSSEQGYAWGVVNVFSGPRIHHFDYFEGGGFNPEWWNSLEGRESITQYSDKIHEPFDVTWLDIKYYKPKILFYHLLTSEVGRHDYVDYLGGAYLFSGSGLSVISGTQHSGAIGGRIFYGSLVAGKTVGEAWKDYISWSIENYGKAMNIIWCDGEEETWYEGGDSLKAVLLGDGFIKINGI